MWSKYTLHNQNLNIVQSSRHDCIAYIISSALSTIHTHTSTQAHTHTLHANTQTLYAHAHTHNYIHTHTHTTTYMHTHTQLHTYTHNAGLSIDSYSGHRSQST